MRARSGCAGCAVAARAACDTLLIQLKLEEDVPRHGLSLLASRRDATWGLADRGRSRSAARKTYHAHGLRTGRAMRRERRAIDAPCRRKWFSRRQLRRTGARLSGRAHRPDDDAVPPMEDIEDDRSEVLDAAEVDRGGLQPLAHAASAAAKTTRTKGGFRHRMALLMLDTHNSTAFALRALSLR